MEEVDSEGKTLMNFPTTSNSFVGDQCSGSPVSTNAGWDPRKAAEKPLVLNKSNKVTILQKKRQKMPNSESNVNLGDLIPLDRVMEKQPGHFFIEPSNLYF